MTRFLDGPAAGTTLTLLRAPHYLRAVCAPDGAWDALDQLDDTPKADERIVVYAMDGEPSVVHVQRRGPNGGRRCGWYRGGAYRVVTEQPADAVLRDRAAWRAWVAEQIGAPLAADGTKAEEE